MEEGSAISIIACLCHNYACNGSILQHQKKLAKGTNRLKALSDTHRITSGVLGANGIHTLSQDVTKLIQARIDAEQKKISIALLKKKNDTRKRQEAILKI